MIELIDTNAAGIATEFVNALLKTVMPRMASDFAGSIKRAIESPGGGVPMTIVRIRTGGTHGAS